MYRQQMLAGGDVLLIPGQIASEMDWFLKRYQPQPKLLLAYDREAFQGRTDKALRITFDHNIRWRTRQWSLAEGSWGTPLLGDDSVLMEIKAFGSLPIWLVNLLAEEQIYPSSFSKYGTWYERNYLEKEGMRCVG